MNDRKTTIRQQNGTTDGDIKVQEDGKNYEWLSRKYKRPSEKYDGRQKSMRGLQKNYERTTEKNEWTTETYKRAKRRNKWSTKKYERTTLYQISSFFLTRYFRLFRYKHLQSW